MAPVQSSAAAQHFEHWECHTKVSAKAIPWLTGWAVRTGVRSKWCLNDLATARVRMRNAPMS